VAIDRAPRFFASLVGALALLCAIALAVPGGASASHLRVAAARKLAAPRPCTSHVAQARAKRMTAQRRRRLARRARSCRRRTATQSSAAGGPIYWGAWIGSQLTGDEAPWDMSAVSKFEQMTGKSMSLIHFSAPFADCSSPPCSFYKFPASEMESIRKHGSIPFFSWASQSTPASLEEPNFQLSDVIAGRYDSYIREFAEAAKAWGHPFFLRFNWEMNGNWFPWMEGVNGNQPGEYVTAWRHVHDIFTAVGANNVSWVWCPNVDPGNRMTNLASLYPGDAYVDWTGLDGYNYGPEGGGWTSFKQLYTSTYHRIAEEIAPSKPMVIGEMGSTESGGSKAAWIQEALSAVPAEYPKVRALLYFEKYDSGMDWPIESSASATSAFAAGIQNSLYLGNSFGNIATSPIPAA